MQVNLLDITGKSNQKISLPTAIFSAKVNPTLIAQAMRVYLANQRQSGTAKTKTRHEIVGSTRKIYKQKGTGKARHGDRKAPIFVGGGKAHGPTGQENYQLKLSKKMRKAALFSALSLKLKENNIMVMDKLTSLKTKTNHLVEVLAKLSLVNKNQKLTTMTLLVLPLKSDKLRLAGRNIAKLSMVLATNLNIYQVMKAQKIIFTPESISLCKQTFLKNDK